MSCIKQLAEQKKQTEGTFYIFEKVALESCGEYKGYDYCTTFNIHGFSCGYVAIPNNHYYADKKKAEDELEMLSYHGAPLVETSCSDIWVGFDCFCDDEFSLNHAISLFPTSEFLISKKEIFEKVGWRSDAFKVTTESMIAECKSLIDQIAKK